MDECEGLHILKVGALQQILEFMASFGGGRRSGNIRGGVSQKLEVSHI